MPNRIRSGMLVISIFAIISAVNAFVPTTTPITAIGKNSNVESPAHTGPKNYARQSSFRRDTMVLTSTQGAEINTSAVSGGARPVLFPLPSISKLSATLSKIGMMAFIVSMCLALPIALFPPHLLYRFNIISKVKQQNMALSAGQFCARWMLRLFPFCKVSCHGSPEKETDPQPCVWVCNHTSALDIFILLAKDHELRGKRKRPIKIVYWKGLEDNPITKLLFTQCGFIPVQMDGNAAGEANNYDMKSFKTLLKMSKQAFEEGFDIGILPEGQLNPHPDEKLLPCFPGAFTLAKMSRRPIRFMALHGTHRLWHAREDIGMTVTGRDIALRVYPGEGRKFKSADEFVTTFETVVGKFATTGKDLAKDELDAWLSGEKWKEISQKSKD
eukprot:CAMPEP_0172403716 /NCGR_PEP_ID=MMETSP1061-20121228/60519_1 /TAXON_ID=37318 /ORGANISM="Pseudo-nitzschia pungens, Strain cf. pungens" /LENGTH=385 /DNA_ID=CAMNT_0013138239 /DNA_START=165 /DNA_END=1322 /DNA_ORIENTATION=+